MRGIPKMNGFADPLHWQILHKKNAIPTGMAFIRYIFL